MSDYQALNEIAAREIIAFQDFPDPHASIFTVGCVKL